jgi:hypothetical protein
MHRSPTAASLTHQPQQHQLQQSVVNTRKTVVHLKVDGDEADAASPKPKRKTGLKKKSATKSKPKGV